MTDTDRPSFLDRQRDAALQQLREQQDEFRRVADIVLPNRRDPYSRSNRRVADVVTLGTDHLVEVVDRNGAGEEVTYWTTVVADKASMHYFHKQDEALLHLIARRNDDNENGSADAAFYAGRVLGLPTTNA